ncbi:MAG TPA: hypothetical protein VN660_13685 [Steroidobacteraceae bacterium]|nr:hypothetical protein [Steroidobacteraceae bacterium]
MLARALGKTLQQLLSETSSAELGEWLAFYELERAGGGPESDPAAAEAQLRAIFGRPRDA